MPLAVGLVLLVVLFSTWYSRRTELSLYRLLGMTRAQSLLFAGTDAALATVLPFSAGVFAALLLQPSLDPLTTSAALNDYLRVVLLLLVAPLLMLLLVRRRRLTAALRGG